MTGEAPAGWKPLWPQKSCSCHLGSQENKKWPIFFSYCCLCLVSSAETKPLKDKQEGRNSTALDKPGIPLAMKTASETQNPSRHFLSKRNLDVNCPLVLTGVLRGPHHTAQAMVLLLGLALMAPSKNTSYKHTDTFQRRGWLSRVLKKCMAQGGSTPKSNNLQSPEMMSAGCQQALDHQECAGWAWAWSCDFQTHFLPQLAFRHVSFQVVLPEASGISTWM